MSEMSKRRALCAVGVIGLTIATLATAPVGTASPASVSTARAAASGWTASARSLRGRNGSHFSFNCPAGGVAYAVWGTTVYTDDSSVCTAAVHAGRITLTRGGKVVIEIRAGRSSYQGSTRHGITSHSWGSWHGSFVVVSASASTGKAGTPKGGSGWNKTAFGLRGHNGSRYAFSCPAHGTAYRVWGTTVYTDDSSVCTAAVHAGRITLARGGRVVIKIRAGRSSYKGSTRHGITSRSWGVWHGSFVFV